MNIPVVGDNGGPEIIVQERTINEPADLLQPFPEIASDLGAAFLYFAGGNSSGPANNSTWQSIKNLARKIGNYIPTICGAGVFNYGGLRVSGDVASVSVNQIRMADTHAAVTPRHLSLIYRSGKV